MSFDPKSSSKARHKKKSPSSCLLCFLGSPVSDSDATERPAPPPRPANAGSRRKLSAWLSYSRILKKEEAKKTVAPAKAASDRKAVPAAKESLSKKSSAKSRSGGNRSDNIVQQHDRVPKPNANPNSEQTSLPQISPKYNARRPPALTSRNSHSIRTRSKGDETATSDHGPAPAGASASTSSRNTTQARTLGPFAGVGVMAVALAILVFSDRLVAVICLCSCLCVLQLVRTASSSSSAAAADNKIALIDMDSDEYKKRVILEGLLERNGRRPSSFAVATAPAAGT